MSRRFNVAVVGCNTLVGEAILTLLQERQFPTAAIHAVDSVAGGRVTFGDKNLKVEPLEAFDFSKVELAFFCLDEFHAEQYVPKAAASGCVVIDDSPCFRLEDDVPLVVAEVNPETLEGYTRQNIIANPGSNALMLTTVLKPLHDVAGIVRINVVTLQAVSGKDKAGVEELAKQATAMFNLKPIESGVFDKQIVFNLLPQIGEVLDDGYTMEEAKLAWESARILANDDLLLNATCVRVPVFHGHGMVLHLETKHLLELEQARDLLANAPAVRLVADDDYPTAVTCAVGEDAARLSFLAIRSPTFLTTDSSTPRNTTTLFPSMRRSFLTGT